MNIIVKSLACLVIANACLYHSFSSTWIRRLQVPPERWCPLAKLHGVII